MTLNEFEKLERSATPEPWISRSLDGVCNKYVDERAIVISPEEQALMFPENVQLIKASRNISKETIALARAIKNCSDQMALYCDEGRSGPVLTALKAFEKKLREQ